ncbi:MAG: hypothetical protein KGI19_00990 [Thaumarchaeota archaeon]|nr:hypothetical protein [Nitrososphaerota archaeon]MDE1817160.1 hypothetical protein [Nitrososphaerota archaeon]
MQFPGSGINLKRIRILLGTVFVISILTIHSFAFAQTSGTISVPPQGNTVPSWVKNTAKLWSIGSVTDDDFIKSIQYLIQQGIISVPATQVSSQTSSGVPSWIKNTVKLWSEGQVTDADFIKGIQYLVQNGIITTQIVSQGSTTDHNGVTTFQISNQSVQFTFVDNATGKPITGLHIALGLDSETRSVGTLLIIDPQNNYPQQIVVLQGDASSTTPVSWQDSVIPYANAQTSDNVVVKVGTDPTTITSLMVISALAKANAHTTLTIAERAHLGYESLELAAKYADKNGWIPVTSTLTNKGYETGTEDDLDQVTADIKAESLKGGVMNTAFLLAAAGGPAGVATGLGYFAFGTLVGVSTAQMDLATVTGCAEHSQSITWVKIGGTKIYSCSSTKGFGLVTYNPPAETTDHVSLELLNKANKGFFERIQTQKGQPIPVPQGDYSMRITAPDKTPVTDDLTVTPDVPTDIKDILPPAENQQITSTITPARDLSGHWSGSFSMKDTTSDGCSFSGSWEATMTQNENDLTGTLVITSANSPDYPANDYCTWSAPDFPFDGTVSSSSFNISAGGNLFAATGSFTTDLIRGNFNECSDGSCASGTFTGSRS